MDVIQGNRSLLQHYDEVKTTWNVVDPIMHAWAGDEHAPLQYPVGSWAPKAADQIFGRADREWRQSPICNGKRKGDH
jgi:glucose-6-phosphate 1-dehydrogenase